MDGLVCFHSIPEPEGDRVAMVHVVGATGSKAGGCEEEKDALSVL
jgi:hypothetical protein